MDVIEIMINIDDEKALIYQNETRYFFEIEGKKNKLIFHTYEEVAGYLYKHGFIWY